VAKNLTAANASSTAIEDIPAHAGIVKPNTIRG
jgi:hypothetical protein